MYRSKTFSNKLADNEINERGLFNYKNFITLYVAKSIQNCMMPIQKTHFTSQAVGTTFQIKESYLRHLEGKC